MCDCNLEVGGLRGSSMAIVRKGGLEYRYQISLPTLPSCHRNSLQYVSSISLSSVPRSATCKSYVFLAFSKIKEAEMGF